MIVLISLCSHFTHLNPAAKIVHIFTWIANILKDYYVHVKKESISESFLSAIATVVHSGFVRSRR
jgi:hypothetical protein